MKAHDWVLWRNGMRVGQLMPRSGAYEQARLWFVDTFELWRFVISHDESLRLFMPEAARGYFEQFAGDEDESA